ncbi:helix-turn-helix transcriptional regulator [Luteolibacter marinus]|uniref:helix-turn-helix transcriptional regulator n=1 Tax=Luteolibacter marinus TaxID=2776705 RepID=UPI001865E2A3|nr:helix-turn-helix transcriptional regulator [Luteolibacter marinus]
MAASKRSEFLDITSRDLKRVDQITARLSEADDRTTLGREFVTEMERFLPADCMLWNVWTNGMERVLEFSGNTGWSEEVLAPHAGAVNETIRFHPVIASGQAKAYWRRPQRMSDFQSYGRFQSNPLYREVYRHIEANYQIGFHSAQLDDGVLNLCWNLKSRDFRDAELQKMHLIGQRVGDLAKRLDQSKSLRATWQKLKDRLESVGVATENGNSMLTPTDGKILAGLISGNPRVEIAANLGCRRDTLDRHIAIIRERLGFDSVAHLLAAMADLAVFTERSRDPDPKKP